MRSVVVGDCSSRQTTMNQQGSIKSRVMQVETVTEKSAATQQRVKEIKKLNANTLSPLHSPQLIRSTRACKVVESNGWNSSVKFKSSSSSGSNSVESIVPKYQMTTNNASALSQKRSYLNQTSTVTKMSNKTMSLRNDKMKKDEVVDKKKTVPTVTAKKLLTKPTFSRPSPTKSFSAKFPNGMPFENEFYHYRRFNRSSVVSDSTNSNNSSDEFTSSQRLSNSPSYHDEFRRNPSNDALYVDFTLKSFDNFNSDDDQKKKKVKQPNAIATKTKFVLTEKNCFCEFSTAQSSSSSAKSSNGQQVDFSNKEPIVYVSSANIFPKCNRVESSKNENTTE